MKRRRKSTVRRRSRIELPRWLRRSRRLWWLPVAGTAALLLVLSVAWFRCGTEGCPDPSMLPALQPGGAPILLDRHGEPFAELHPLERRVVPLDSLPPYLPAAFIAVEDRRFFSHRGVDWRRLASAGLAALRPGGRDHGASTLTMQLARTLFPERVPGEERTLRRKLVEIRVARQLERRFTKEEILELYLNYVYFGAGAYGISAGAHHYFGLPATEVDVAGAALLAGVINAPARLDPRRHPDRSLARRNLVLALMEQQAVLTPEEAGAARDLPVAAPEEPPSLRAPTAAPYFVDAVRRFLEEELGEALYRSRLRIHTTLDPGRQTAAEEELARQLTAVEEGRYGSHSAPPYDPLQRAGASGTDYLQGAVVMLEAGSGDVLALVGGRDFAHSRFNRALYARRSMGSAFKPFVYAAALSEGLVASQPVADRPIRMTQEDGSTWAPRNFDGQFRGRVSMREALVESLNVPTVRLALAAGPERVAAAGALAGIAEPVPLTPAAALGTVSVSPVEMAVAYASFPLLGERPAPLLIRRVETADGEVLFEARPERENGMSADVAFVLTDILRAVVDRGTGQGVRAAGYQGRAAGKTGTSQDVHDVWFVGFTPSVVTAVWMGFDTPRPILAGASGGMLAAPVWGRIMARAESDGGSEEWPVAEGVVARQVDPSNGVPLVQGCPPLDGESVRELFLVRYVPEPACPVRPGLVSRFLGFFRGGDPDDGDDGPWEPQWLSPGAPSGDILGEPRIPVPLR